MAIIGDSRQSPPLAANDLRPPDCHRDLIFIFAMGSRRPESGHVSLVETALVGERSWQVSAFLTSWRVHV